MARIFVTGPSLAKTPRQRSVAGSTLFAAPSVADAPYLAPSRARQA
jgi:hypothetical protein